MGDFGARGGKFAFESGGQFSWDNEARDTFLCVASLYPIMVCNTYSYGFRISPRRRRLGAHWLSLRDACSLRH